MFQGIYGKQVVPMPLRAGINVQEALHGSENLTYY